MKTRKGVEIARVGRFKLSTGWAEFTRERLASAVAKLTGRPAPRIGIGHTDERWNAAGDGSPALGRVENLTLAEDGELLVGDLVDMPDWFADALPSAFPGRSIEGTVEGDDLTITALKVLGTTMPGIHTLADLEQFVSDDGPALVAAGADNDGHEFTVVLDAGDTGDTHKPPAPSRQKENHMSPKEIRQTLGLPEHATDKQVLEELSKGHPVTQAVRAHKIMASEEPVWREKYRRDPAATRETLQKLVSVAPRSVAASATSVYTPPSASTVYAPPSAAPVKAPSSSGLSRGGPGDRTEMNWDQFQASQDRLRAKAGEAPVNRSLDASVLERAEREVGLKPNPNTDPFGVTTAPPPVQPDHPKGVTIAAGGTVLWEGVPCRMTEKGAQVWYADGWVDVQAFEALGLGVEDTRTALYMTMQFGTKQQKNEIYSVMPNIAYGLL